MSTGGLADAQTDADFKGKSISINIGGWPSGSPDIYFRGLAKHHGRFIPGNAAVIAKKRRGDDALPR